jgi:hypothetical protein
VSWLQLDDNMPDHPKVAALTDTAFRHHIEGLSYCARLLTDGFIPAKVAADITTPKTLLELESEQLPGRAPLWERSDRGWEIHDYLVYNPSREQVLDRREKKSRGGKKGAATRWGADGSSNGSTHDKSDGSTHSRSDDISHGTSDDSSTPSAMGKRHAPSQSQDLKPLEAQSEGESSGARTRRPGMLPDLQKIKATDLDDDVVYEIERLLTHLTDKDEGTPGRLVALARRGATARHFADARQGITTSTTRGSSSKKACQIIEAAVTGDVAL